MKFIKLAKQMKESYTNHWNEVHPDNKIEASDNFKVGDKVFFDTLYEFQEDDLGFNYNRGTLKEIKHWPSNNREYYIVQTDDGKLLEVGHVFHTEEEADAFRNSWMNPKFEKESTITQPNKSKPTTVLPDNMQWAWDPEAADWIAVLKDNPSVTPPTYNPNQTNMYSTTTTTGMTPIKSSLVECLNNFIDGGRYSKEIKIEAGLIKGGFIAYSGFDMYKGTRYSITQKGLEYLKRAAQQEYDLEKEHLDAKKSYLLDGISESELQTGDVTYKGLMPKKTYSIFEINGEELAKGIEASSEVDAKVKFTLQHPEYEDSQTIYATEISESIDNIHKVIKSEEVTDEQLEESWNKYYPLYRKDIEEEKITEENYPANDEVAQKLKTTLSMYLYGLKRYRKAIPIMKYHTNAKMKRVVEDGHSKGLSEDEITKQVDAIAEEYYKKENKIRPTFNSLSEDYLKSFLFGMIKNNKTASLNKFTKQWNICEADGSKLGKVTASSELDAKIKFTLQHPEYKDSQTIYVKESGKEIDANYSETTDKALFYPNPSISPSTDIELENHDGWVNTASSELLDLHNILTHLKMNELADVEIGNDKVEIYSTPELINTLEHQIKDSGLHCQVTEESKNNPKYDWKLTVFLK